MNFSNVEVISPRLNNSLDVLSLELENVKDNFNQAKKTYDTNSKIVELSKKNIKSEKRIKDLERDSEQRKIDWPTTAILCFCVLICLIAIATLIIVLV